MFLTAFNTYDSLGEAYLTAGNDKPAFTIWIDEACWWFMGDDIVSNADLHGVLLSNGKCE